MKAEIEKYIVEHKEEILIIIKDEINEAETIEEVETKKIEVESKEIENKPKKRTYNKKKKYETERD